LSAGCVVIVRESALDNNLSECILFLKEGWNGRQKKKDRI
jgi:hypothetical protein